MSSKKGAAAAKRLHRPRKGTGIAAPRCLKLQRCFKLSFANECKLVAVNWENSKHSAYLAARYGFGLLIMLLCLPPWYLSALPVSSTASLPGPAFGHGPAASQLRQWQIAPSGGPASSLAVGLAGRRGVVCPGGLGASPRADKPLRYSARTKSGPPGVTGKTLLPTASHPRVVGGGRGRLQAGWRGPCRPAAGFLVHVEPT